MLKPLLPPLATVAELFPALLNIFPVKVKRVEKKQLSFSSCRYSFFLVQHLLHSFHFIISGLKKCCWLYYYGENTYNL